MRLQMAHMRRAQCCLSDFCSVSKVTMIDGYFWINKTTFFSLYTCEYIYIYLCVFILKYTRFEKFHWTSSPVITGWERVPPRVSFDLTLSQNFETISLGLHSSTIKSSFTILSQLIRFSALTRWWNQSSSSKRRFEKIHTAPGHDARRNPNNLRIPATIES